MRNLKLTISYDGTNYCGWQVQPNGVAVQEVIEKAVKQMTGEGAALVASGRTDAGVHAVGQVANFKTSKDNISCGGFLKGLNSILPRDIRILDVEEAGADFHAQKDAKSKCYRYLILNGELESPLWESRFWVVRGKLDVKAMRAALDCLIGKHDFSAFCASDDCSKDKVRDILSASIAVNKSDEFSFFLPEGENVILVDICGRGFLKNMVRNIVGTLVGVGQGKCSVSQFGEILKSLDRTRAGRCAPAHGLYLLNVDY